MKLPNFASFMNNDLFYFSLGEGLMISHFSGYSLTDSLKFQKWLTSIFLTIYSFYTHIWGTFPISAQQKKKPQSDFFLVTTN